jgi:hypothetical protein
MRILILEHVFLLLLIPNLNCDSITGSKQALAAASTQHSSTGAGTGTGSSGFSGSGSVGSDRSGSQQSSGQQVGLTVLNSLPRDLIF